MFARVRQGFTLIELIVVVTILAVVSVVVVVSVARVRQQTIAIQAASLMQSLSLALEQYQLGCGQYPPQDGSGQSLSYEVSAGCANGVTLGSFVPEFEREDYQSIMYVPVARSVDPDLCIGYHMGTLLGDVSDERLDTDADASTEVLPSGLVICLSQGAPSAGIDGADPVLDYVTPRALEGSL